MRVQCAHAYRVVWTGGFFPVGNEGLLSRPVTSHTTEALR